MHSHTKRHSGAINAKLGFFLPWAYYEKEIVPEMYYPNVFW